MHPASPPLPGSPHPGHTELFPPAVAGAEKDQADCSARPAPPRLPARLHHPARLPRPTRRSQHRAPVEVRRQQWPHPAGQEVVGICDKNEKNNQLTAVPMADCRLCERGCVQRAGRGSVRGRGGGGSLSAASSISNTDWWRSPPPARSHSTPSPSPPAAPATRSTWPTEHTSCEDDF